MIIKMVQDSIKGELCCNSEAIVTERWVLWFNVRGAGWPLKIVMIREKWSIENFIRAPK